jgi:hypothetical protein
MLLFTVTILLDIISRILMYCGYCVNIAIVQKYTKWWKITEKLNKVRVQSSGDFWENKNSYLGKFYFYV